MVPQFQEWEIWGLQHQNQSWKEKQYYLKDFADINSIDIEIDSSDPNEIVKSIKNIAGSFGGINLEDIAAPDCFIIEKN